MRPAPPSAQRLAAPAPIAAKIAAFEAEHARLIEQWAVQQADDSAPPELPHAAAIEDLRAEMRQAESIAAGAKAAFPRLLEEITACQADARITVETMHCAADGVLMEDAAVIAAELSTAEARAALLMGRLVALQRHFQLEAHRGRQDAAPAATAVNGMVPQRPALDNSTVERGIGAWKSFTNRLFGDENATFEESKT